LGSHTASDRTSKTAGDIEIYENDTVYEAIEIKLDKAIDKTIVNIAIEKIIRFNPVRYYILSDSGVKNEDKKIIENSINEIKEKHGCQIIINGITPTLKYYLRLIDDLNEFIKIYSNLIEKDCELKNIHKNTWNKIIETDL
jgi:DNA (cytosine-5)-methyltransferase 1